MVIGNKNDKGDHRTVSMEEAQQFCENENLTYFETSAKNGENVQMAWRDMIEAMIQRRIRLGGPKNSVIGNLGSIKLENSNRASGAFGAQA